MSCKSENETHTLGDKAVVREKFNFKVLQSSVRKLSVFCCAKNTACNFLKEET